MRLRLTPTSIGSLAPVTLSVEQMRGIGEEMVRSQKARWLRGQNADDQPAKPLARVTAKGKRTYGVAPVRDMVMTGLTYNNFTLRKATQTEVRAENSSREGRRRARKCQRYENMIGLAPSDIDNIFTYAYRAYSAYLQRAWRP